MTIAILKKKIKWPCMKITVATIVKKIVIYILNHYIQNENKFNNVVYYFNTCYDKCCQVYFLGVHLLIMKEDMFF